MTDLKRDHRILLGSLILLLLAASRIVHLRGLELIDDEVWAIWRTFGTPGQILTWVPYDWPPLYYLILGGWKELTGIHPTMARFLSVLVSVLGAAFTYLVMRRLFNTRAALLSMLVFGALSYAVFLGTYLRGYIFVVAMLPLALWLTDRFFARPSWRRAFWLALWLAAMFYTYMTSAVAFFMLGLYTLIVYPRQVWRWWQPAVIALPIAAPLIIDRMSVVVGRTGHLVGRELPPLLNALWDFYSHYGGEVALVWLAIFPLATGLVLWRRRFDRRALVLLLWVVGGPLLMYAFDNLLDFFSPRYSWWVLTGVVLWLGLGLSYLPRRALPVAGVGLVALMFTPIPFREYAIQGYNPMLTNLQWLSERAQAGDAILMDTHCGCGLTPRPVGDGDTLALDDVCTCGHPEEWRYFTDVFFPQGGLHFITEPDPRFRRVWYVRQDGWHDTTLQNRLQRDYIPGDFVGPWDMLIQLYEAPPDPEGIAFANGMRFHGVDFIDPDGTIWTGPLLQHEGETVQMRLWWSADEPIDFDYSTSIQIFRDEDGRLVTQLDGPPQVIDAPDETSQWQPGRYYRDERTFVTDRKTSDNGRALSYSIYLTVYDWTDGTRISAPGVNGDHLLPLRNLYVKAR